MYQMVTDWGVFQWRMIMIKMHKDLKVTKSVKKAEGAGSIITITKAKLKATPEIAPMCKTRFK